MKKTGTLNSHLSKVLSDLGHTDKVVIADAGLPIPKGVPRIDLSLKRGVPSFLDVVDVVLEDMVVENIVLAEELKTQNPLIHEGIQAHLSDKSVTYVQHEAFKAQCQEAKVVIRTGEVTPYANCILEAGVFF